MSGGVERTKVGTVREVGRFGVVNSTDYIKELPLGNNILKVGFGEGECAFHSKTEALPRNERCVIGLDWSNLPHHAFAIMKTGWLVIGLIANTPVRR